MLKRLLPALVPLFFAAVSSCAVAGQLPRSQLPRNAGAYERLIKVANGALSMSEAIDRVRKSTGGRVLDAEDAGSYYRIKVLTRDGEVRVMKVDARTGRIQ
jgi:uncharacterized membrane protein YkoI